MIPSHGEWQEQAKKARAEKAAEHAPQLQMLRQAAFQAEMLTGIPAFDQFLSYLAAAVEDTEGHLKAFEAILADPKVVDTEAIMLAKIAMTECRGRLDAFNAAISLPKDIIEKGAKAKKLLDRMPEAV